MTNLGNAPGACASLDSAGGAAPPAHAAWSAGQAATIRQGNRAGVFRRRNRA